MPGILGIISQASKELNKQNTESMLQCMLHESFYSSGTFFSDAIGICAGWICHKESFCDCMPVWNEKKNIALIFFGENFADKEVFDKLKSKNHKFDNTNASYLVHLYEEMGLQSLQQLNGWFSGLIIDLRDNKTILFNDRYGMQKIFYYEGKDGLYFASEAKALLKVIPDLRNLDMKGLGELLACGCTLDDRTLYKNVFLLPCASAWTIQNGTIKKDKYFNPESWENQSWLEKEFFYERLKETFIRILPRYFRSNQSIGISLTGGLDTRMILANTAISAGKYPCYTFASMYRDCNDVIIARKVAALMEQTHQTIPVDNNFLVNFKNHAEKTVYITDGYLDVSNSTEGYVNDIARNIAPIRMTGNYGSEVLRNIRWLTAWHPNKTIFHHDFTKSIHETFDTLKRINQNVSNPLTFTLFNEAPWLENRKLVSEQAQLTLRTPYMDNDLVSLMYRAPMGARDSKELSLRLIADGNPVLAAIPTDRGYGGNIKFPLANLAHFYNEFFFKAEYAYNYGMPQWLARFDHTFKFMHFENLFLGRHKFAHFRIWYRDQLANYVKNILLDKRTLNRPYLNRKVVEEVVGGHTKGYRNYTTEITQLLTIELIQRLLIENG